MLCRTRLWRGGGVRANKIFSRCCVELVSGGGGGLEQTRSSLGVVQNSSLEGGGVRANKIFSRCCVELVSGGRGVRANKIFSRCCVELVSGGGGGLEQTRSSLGAV